MDSTPSSPHPPDPNGTPPAHPGPKVVGIGASAGGLAAVRAFLSEVPEDSGLAYVVVMHLASERPSHLAELLQPHAKMPVQQVTETTPLEPNNVYVIPPGANLDAIDTHLRLSELEEKRSDRAPIDHFFRTLASTHDGSSVGVILSGTGSDGTLGLKAIKEKNGFILVQDPDEAEYDGMPRSAVATEMVDLILPLAKLPGAILDFARTAPRIPLSPRDDDLAEEERRLLQKIFAQIRAHAGRDFSAYKRSTILRRIHRRMQLTKVEELANYLEILRKRPSEVSALADELLITVTNFFRDAEVFRHLQQEVIPGLFENCAADETIRVWSVGCASGEEAYSLAILLLEEAQRRDFAVSRLQIFASDLHEASLQRAREGFYPGDIATDVSEERLERFFQRENGGYQIRKEVRETVVFAPHNLLSDPPFSRLQLVVCRNLLIYLQREIQRDIIELFHYALRSDGFLLLGTSETLEAADLFRHLDKQCCLYQKRNVPAPDPRLPVFPLFRLPRVQSPPGEHREQDPVSFGRLHQEMVELYAPPSMLLSPDDKVVHLSVSAGRYLVHPGGEITASAHKLLRKELRIELASGLRAAREKNLSVRSRPILVAFDGEERLVVLHIRSSSQSDHEGFVLVIFDEHENTQQGRKHSEAQDPPTRSPREIRELEAELELTKQRLQAVIEEHETSQEEMKASNEELQSTNEELRSTMEELETSKEELQSINEELQTVNQENRHKVEELAQLSGDLQNLLSSTQIATLFLDRSLRIMRFTSKVGDLFNIRPTDRGRPLADLTHRLGYESLQADAKEVLRRLVPVEREVEDEEGHFYLARLLPYRSTDDRIEGVVLTFIDISSRKKAEQALRKSEETYRLLVSNAREYAIVMLDPDGRVTTWNAGAKRIFGYAAEEIVGRPGELLFTAEDRAAGVPAREMEAAAKDDTASDDRWHCRRDGTRFWASGVMEALRDKEGALRGFAKVMRDNTERKATEVALRESEERYRSLTDLSPDATLVNLDGRYVYANEAAARMVGAASPQEVVGRSPFEFLREQDHEFVRERIRLVLAEGKNTAFHQYSWKRLDGSSVEVEVGASPTRWDGRPAVQVVARDLTERFESAEALRLSEERYRLLVESAREYAILMLDPEGRVTSWNSGAERIFGYASDEILGQPQERIFRPEDRADGLPETKLKEAAERGTSMAEVWLVRKDGSTFWASGVVEALRRPDGSLGGFVKVLRDNTERKEAEEALQELNESLEARVEERTREVREQEARIRQMASRLTVAEQEERRRLSQILHDDLQQLLYGIQMQLAFFRETVTAGDPASALPKLNEVEDWIRDGIETTRQLTVDLSPPVLRHEGLRDTLIWIKNQMEKLHDLKVEIAAEADFDIADEDLRVLLYQTARELLFNVAKHAETDRARIELVEEPPGIVTLRVIDQGRGFDHSSIAQSDKRGGGFGLYSVRERLALFGGELEVESGPGAGTCVTARLPQPSR